MAAVAQSLSAVLRVRVGRLGRDAAVLARTVSVLGDDVSVTEACAVAGLEREAALVAAAVLAGAGIFASDRVNCFAHPLVRAAVEADLLAAERALIEERALAVLLHSGADPARVAVHLLRTEPSGDPRAVAALRAAARSAAGAAAPHRAVVLLRRAHAEEPVRGRELLGELAEARALRRRRRCRGTPSARSPGDGRHGCRTGRRHQAPEPRGHAGRRRRRRGEGPRRGARRRPGRRAT